MERMNKTKYVLGIYNANCYKLLMSSVFVVWLVNGINELELYFWVIIPFILTQKCCKFLKTYLALLVLYNEKHYYIKKNSSSSTMSFTNLTTKTELVKSLQLFALNVKMYKNVISTQNVVHFSRHILPYVSFLMEDIITKKTVQVR